MVEIIGTMDGINGCSPECYSEIMLLLELMDAAQSIRQFEQGEHGYAVKRVYEGGIAVKGRRELALGCGKKLAYTKRDERIRDLYVER